MPNPLGSFIWYELMTDDVSAAKRFYDSVVGWDIDPNTVAPGVNYRMIKRSDGGMAGGVLELDDKMREGGARPVWLGYLNTDDVDAKVEEIKSDGGGVMMEPWDQPGVGRLAMVTGPEGAPIYLMNRGWKKSTLKAGDRIRVTIAPLRNGRRGGELVRATTADGRSLV